MRDRVGVEDADQTAQQIEALLTHGLQIKADGKDRFNALMSEKTAQDLLATLDLLSACSW